MPASRANTIILSLTALAAGCTLLTPFEPTPAIATDGDADHDADGDANRDADRDVDEPDGDGPSGAGPLLLVVQTVEATPEAICDVDGDGEADGAIAELGRELAPVVADMYSLMLNGSRSPGDQLAIFIPHVDDLAGPDMEDAVAMPFGALDTDVPVDPSDDFDGQEPFFIGHGYLDECGEPIHHYEGLRIQGGEVSGGTGILVYVLGHGFLELEVTEHRGSIAPGGASFDIMACGLSTVTSLGATGEDTDDVGGLSVLELIVGGGEALGLTGLPGIQPDVDLDGDGLERIVLDDEGRVFQCVDGDRTVLESPDCWQDPRIADAFALTFELRGSSGRFAGRAPGWQLEEEWTCRSWPVEESFFDTAVPLSDSCAHLDDLCDPLSEAPCCDPAHLCSGEDRRQYRCSETCTPLPCLFLGRDGTCDVAAGHPVCRPVSEGVEETDCTPGAPGCTTAWGVSHDTACIEYHGNTYCLELCETGAAPCPADHWCEPRLFEEDVAVCIFR